MDYTQKRLATNGKLIQIEDLVAFKKDYKSHQKNVTKRAGELGSRIALGLAKIEELKEAAFYHDIGKIRLLELVNKPGPLSKDEYAEIKKHAQYSYEMIIKMGHSKKIATIIKYHHENQDGSGYFGLEGDQIPLKSKIIRIVDVYSALTEKRCYKPSMRCENAIEIMIKEKSKFDPGLLEIFINSLSKYPCFELTKENERSIIKVR